MGPDFPSGDETQTVTTTIVVMSIETTTTSTISETSTIMSILTDIGNMMVGILALVTIIVALIIISKVGDRV